jgi:DNA-binding beta-propeller fold protein YncE
LNSRCENAVRRLVDLLRTAAITGAVAAAVFGLAGCDEDCPVCPSAEPISDYDIYIGGSEPDNPILVYNTRLRTITDTIIFTDMQLLADLAVSADGKYLLIATNPPSGFYPYTVTVYDLETLDTVKSYPGGNQIEVSNTGKYIAVFGYRTDSISFLDGATFEPYFSEKRAFMSGRFSADDSKFYCVSHTNEIFIYDMAAKTLDTVLYYYDNSGYWMALSAVQPSLDGKRLYLLASYSYYFHCIMSYLPESDSSVLQYWIGPPKGDIRLTPDGNCVIVTDPGAMAIEEIGSENIIYIDTRTDAVVALVPAPLALAGGECSEIFPGEIAILPDGRFTMVATESYEAFGMVDNHSHEFADIERPSIERASCKKVACCKARK